MLEKGFRSTDATAIIYFFVYLKDISFLYSLYTYHKNRVTILHFLSLVFGTKDSCQFALLLINIIIFFKVSLRVFARFVLYVSEYLAVIVLYFT